MAFEKLGATFNKFFTLDPEEEDVAPVQPTTAAPAQPTPQNFRGNKVVAMNQPNDKTAKIVVYEPRVYSDAKEIGTHLLNNRAVVVNFDRIEPEAATRIVDFLTGTVFAINGEIKRIGEHIFLATPANLLVDGSLAHCLGQDQDVDLRD